MNRLILAGAVVMLFATTAFGANIVVNGGFETGDWTGWSGNLSAGQATHWEVDSSGAYAHTGNSAALMGPTYEGYIYEDLATTPGMNYEITYWLKNPVGGGINFSFACDWNGPQISTLLTNNAAFPYTKYDYFATATGSQTELKFVMTNQGDFFALDDVSVSAVPEPASMTLLGMGALGLLGFIRRKRTK